MIREARNDEQLGVAAKERDDAVRLVPMHRREPVRTNGRSGQAEPDEILVVAEEFAPEPEPQADGSSRFSRRPS